MDFYPWLVVAHVLGAFGFVAGHGVSMFAAFRLRSERDPGRVTALLDLSGASLGVVYVSLLVLLAAGIAAGFVGGHWGSLWIWTSIAILVAVIALMYVLATPYYGNIRRAVGQKVYGDKKEAPPPEPLPAGELAMLLDTSRPYLLAAIGGIGLAAIIGLMFLKPF
ncbi:MAG TPA: hypothetical protein VF013_05940 [Candidatus Limnocylindria bacterium]